MSAVLVSWLARFHNTSDICDELIDVLAAGKPKLGLVLPGGGARCAYQVGVLKGIAELVPVREGNPFSVLSGTSAGAINAVVLASNAMRFHTGVERLAGVWSNFEASKVYRTDSLTMLKSSAHWMATIVLGGLGLRNPRSLLDNLPLRQLLETHIHFDRIRQAIERGRIDAVSVTSAGYSSARSISFFEGRDDLQTWSRARREGRRTRIRLDHLMASVAVPLLFPPVFLHGEYFGDGAMRELTPLSSAVHLGADRLLIIGVRDARELASADTEPQYPTLGHIAGYMLDTLFMDSLTADLERLERINQMLAHIPPGALTGDVAGLKRIDPLVIKPSEDLREITRRHAHELPLSVRLLMRGLGVGTTGGRQLISFLLFESGYCRELIELGYRDAIAEKDRIVPFIAGHPLRHTVAEPAAIA